VSAVLEAVGVGLRIGRTALLDDVTLRLDPGELCAVVGPNGAGKTSLLRVLGGELKPTAGRVLLEGRPLHGLPPWRLAMRRAVMPQATSLDVPFTAVEVVRLGVEGVGRARRGPERERLAASALERVGLGAFGSRLYQTLSGGERQRVHAARALAQLEAGASGEPQILLLDEPTASLDLRHQFDLLAEARRVACGGAAVLAVLHDLQLASAFADRVVVMAQGRIAASGPPAEVLTRETIRGTFRVELIEEHLPPPPWQVETGARP
jgi:iron complex transport system ATP-binding protein